MSKNMRGLLVALMILGSVGMVKGEAEKTLLAPTFEMEKYKVAFNKGGEFVLYYKDKKILSTVRINVSGVGSIFKDPTFITIKQIDIGKECSWEKSIEEIGGAFKCRLTLLKDKVIWDFDFGFDKEFKGSISHYPRFFTGNLENVLSTRFETGKAREGSFPEQLPDGWKDWTGNFKEIKLFSRLGLIEFRVKADIPGYISGIVSKSSSYLYMSLPRLHEAILPAGYKNHIRLEVSFSENKVLVLAKAESPRSVSKLTLKTVKKDDPKWIGNNQYRIDVEVVPKEGDYRNCPILLNMKLDKLSEELGIGKIDENSIMVVEHDKSTGEPLVYDQSKSDLAKYEVPSNYRNTRWLGGAFKSMPWLGIIERIEWLMRDRNHTHYSVYFDTLENGPKPKREPVVIGAGERLSYPDEESVWLALTSCPSRFEIVDFDNDGDWDIRAMHKKSSGKDMLAENIGSNKKPLFAPPRYIDETKWNYRKCSVEVDWDGDGDKDIICLRNDPSQCKTREAQIYRRGKYKGQLSWAGEKKDRHWIGTKLDAYLYLRRNIGEDNHPQYEEIKLLDKNGEEVLKDTLEYGLLAHAVGIIAGDWDKDGDIDLLIGSPKEELEYIENIGSHKSPVLEHKRFLSNGKPIKFPAVYNIPKSIDWDGDGDEDIITVSRNTFVQYLENISKKGKLRFKEPVYFKQKGGYVSAGVIISPAVGDWDNDEDPDLIIGNHSGGIIFVENKGSRTQPKWAAARYLRDQNVEIIDFDSLPYGTHLYPCEYWEGISNPVMCDWDKDGDMDLIVQTSSGELYFIENVGSSKKSILKIQRIKCDTEDDFLVAWRCKPGVVDVDGDGNLDLITMGRIDGALRYFERVDKITVKKGRPLKFTNGKTISTGGKVPCRGKFEIADWDGDGRWDIIMKQGCLKGKWDPELNKYVDDAEFAIRWFRNVGTKDGLPVFEPKHMYARGKPFCPEEIDHETDIRIIDLDGDGKQDMIEASFNGFIHFYRNSYFRGGEWPEIKLKSVFVKR